MRAVLLTLGIALGLCGSVCAQDLPTAEIFGGYSYVSVDTSTNNLIPRQSANGWEASVSGNVNRWFAIEGDVSGYYRGYTFDLSSIGLPSATHVNVSDYSYGAGPRVNYRPFFIHAILGGDHLSANALGVSRSQDSFAGAFGGGVQWKVAPQWAVRASADYAFTRHNVLGGPAITQDNIRASVGVVYLFSRARQEGSPAIDRAQPACQPIDKVAVLGITGCEVENGFKVISLGSGSPAERAGVEEGSVIVKIDGRPVRTGSEIESTTAASTTGTVRISYLVKGIWLTEQQATVR